MGCHRFKRSQKPGAHTDMDLSYQVPPAELPLPLPEHTEEVAASSTEIALAPDDEGSAGHPKQLSERLTDRFRKRFSKESRSSQTPSRKAVKETGFVHLRSRQLNPIQRTAAVNDAESSLTSVRGYDSDAQFIATPSQLGQTAGSALSSPTSTRRMSMSRHRGALSDLSERSHEAPKELVQNTQDIPPSSGGFDVSARVAIPMSGASSGRFGAFNSPIRRKELKRPVSSTKGQQALPLIENNNLATRSSSLTSVSEAQDGHRFSTAKSRHGSTHIDQNVDRRPASVGSSNTMIEEPSDIVAEKRKQVAVNDSSSLETRSIHLVDLNISKALASSSTLPVARSPEESFHGSRSPSGYNICGVSDQGPRIKEMSAGSPMLNLEEATGDCVISQRRDASSVYLSQRGSFSTGSGPPVDFQVPRMWHIDAVEHNIAKPSIKPDFVSSYVEPVDHDPELPLQDPNPTSVNASAAEGDCSVPKTQPRQSRFKEHLDEDIAPYPSPLELQEDNDAELATRKVSAGWMSGGKRMGYGYRMVPFSEETNTASMRRSRVSFSKERDVGQKSAGQDTTISSRLRNFSASSLFHRQKDRRPSGAVTLSSEPTEIPADDVDVKTSGFKDHLKQALRSRGNRRKVDISSNF